MQESAIARVEPGMDVALEGRLVCRSVQYGAQQLTILELLADFVNAERPMVRPVGAADLDEILGAPTAEPAPTLEPVTEPLAA